MVQEIVNYSGIIIINYRRARTLLRRVCRNTNSLYAPKSISINCRNDVIMEILAIIGILILGLLVFVGGGLFGWVITGISTVTQFLFQGCGNSIGCLVFILFILFCFFAILS